MTFTGSVTTRYNNGQVVDVIVAGPAAPRFRRMAAGGPIAVGAVPVPAASAIGAVPTNRGPAVGQRVLKL